MLGQQAMWTNMQLIRRETLFFIPTSSVFLAFGLALQEISLNFNKLTGSPKSTESQS